MEGNNKSATEAESTQKGLNDNGEENKAVKSKAQ